MRLGLDINQIFVVVHDKDDKDTAIYEWTSQLKDVHTPSLECMINRS